MFNFFKSEAELTVSAPVAGELIDITAVADGVFAAKMLGDGFAVLSTGGEVTAPCTGKLSYVAETQHAFVVESMGMQIMVHVGIDTVALKGQGFKLLAQTGLEVTAGQPILEVDWSYLQEQGKQLTTVVTVVNGAEVVKKMEKDLNNPKAVLEIYKK